MFLSCFLLQDIYDIDEDEDSFDGKMTLFIWYHNFSFHATDEEVENETSNANRSKCFKVLHIVIMFVYLAIHQNTGNQKEVIHYLLLCNCIVIL